MRNEYFLTQFNLVTFTNYLFVNFRSIEDRLTASRKLSDLETLPGPFVCDSISNGACRAFGSFPDRLAIVHQGKVAYLGGVGPHGYKVYDR